MDKGENIYPAPVRRGKKVFGVTVKRVAYGVAIGELYDLKEKYIFYGLFDLVHKIDALCEINGGPQRTNNYRYFNLDQYTDRLVAAKRNIELIQHSAVKMGNSRAPGVSFRLEVVCRAHASMQGKIVFMTDEAVSYRSAFEMMCLIDDVITKAGALNR